ncbi:L,D-transpeptidase [Mycolicibacterium chlorophenolicum]|uniref:Putative L,D-transpeptidase LppS n=1 Tax=Mycolicibacterium chlorophenolicum TaxID=37916 RepID=A0A0J6VVD6_9MYCO|nr:L,D-transpeptidase [Mycolicibacterium chlorophenolicum]KMO73468.1 putative L,D-transpeptidase LppS precursor [Mycolicibacterium chlorophenolicum]
MARHAAARAVRTVVAGIVVAAALLWAAGANAEPVQSDQPGPVTPTWSGDPLSDAIDPTDPAVMGPSKSTADPELVTSGIPDGQNPTPYTGPPVFAPPSFNPVNGSMVGVAKPIAITFQRPIANRSMAEQAIHISSNPPVPGKFYWISDTEVRWRPINFWPANTTVSIDASGTKSSFSTGEALVASIDDATHQMTITRNGVIEKTFPVSLGKPKYETKNGTYYVLEKFADIVMDSSTYGVPIDSPEGYKLNVQDAVRIDNSGIFVHGAPWSVADQGKRNVSHGCINLSPANAQWFYDNFGSGDAVIVKNTTGGVYIQPDGAQDWQL